MPEPTHLIGWQQVEILETRSGCISSGLGTNPTCEQPYLGRLKAQSSKPQGLSTLLGKKKKRSIHEALFEHTFLAVLEEAQSTSTHIFYFIAKKDIIHQN